MKHFGLFIICCVALLSSALAEEAPLLTAKERVQQISEQYQQQRRIQEIALEQKEAEERKFSPEVNFDSFTLTEADEIHSPVASRAPAQAQ